MKKFGLGLVLVGTLVAAGCSDNVDAPKITAGAGHACAIDESRDQVVCWGDNGFGQLGNEEFTAEGTSKPQQVKVISGFDVIAVSAGHSHTCALMDNEADDDSDNTVACWGYNHYGQLGDGSVVDRNVPTYVLKQDGQRLKGVVQVSTGAYHTCAITMVKTNQSGQPQSGGEVYCWGQNSSAQIGNGLLSDTPLATAVQGIGIQVAQNSASGVMAGTAHSCALINTQENVDQSNNETNPDVWCWGDASRDQMPGVEPAENASYVSSPTDIGLQVDGSKLAGIRNIFGERVSQADVPHTPEAAPAFGAAWQPAAHNEEGAQPLVRNRAYGQTCVQTNDKVVCWGGSNQYGQLGDGTPGKTTQATILASELRKTPEGDGLALKQVKSFAAGRSQACVIAGNQVADDAEDDGAANAISCWGFSSGLGQQPSEDATHSPLPGNRIVIEPGSDAKPEGVAVGDEFACYAAGGAQPQIWCWGKGDKGQLGLVDNASSYTPQCVQGYCPATNKDANEAERIEFESAPPPAPVFVSMYAGKDYSCAQTEGGGEYCWGTIAEQEVSWTGRIEERNAYFLYATNVKEVLPPQPSSQCQLTDAGGVQCRGGNADGSLGNGTNTSSSEWVDVNGLSSGVKKIASTSFKHFQGFIPANSRTHCALLQNGSVQCWGFNGHGQLGNGGFDGSNVPVQVLGSGNKIVDLVGGDSHFCALGSTGSVQCWGENGGHQAGNNSAVNAHAPVQVQGLSGPADSLYADDSDFTCAFMRSGGLECWGAFVGPLWNGNEGKVIGKTAVAIQNLDGEILSLHGGKNAACAIMANGTVKCFGYDTDALLGHGQVSRNLKPHQAADVVNLTNVKDVQVGYRHACALVGSGDVFCWGDNAKALLGNGDAGVLYSRTELEAGIDGKPDYYPLEPTPQKVLVREGSHDATLTVDGAKEGSGQIKAEVELAYRVGDLDYAFDCDGDRTYEIVKEEAGHECFYSYLDSGEQIIRVKIRHRTGIVYTTGAAQEDEEIVTLRFDVENLPPVIEEVNTDHPYVLEGSAEARNFKISVKASDPANGPSGNLGLDTLRYSYDCNGDWQYNGRNEYNRGPENICDLSGLAPGTYLLWVAVSDDDGAETNTGSVFKPFAVTVKPKLFVDLDSKPAKYSSDANPTLLFSSQQTSTIEYKLDDAEYTLTSNGTASYSSLADGSYTLYARAVSDGLIGDVTSYSWTVDTVAPETVSDTSYTEPVLADSVTVSFHGTDSNAGAGLDYYCNLDSAGWQSCASGDSFAGSTEGSHAVAVTAVDAAGNADATPAVVSWDRVKPYDATLTAGPVADSRSNDTSPVFAFSSPAIETYAVTFECRLDTPAGTGSYANCDSTSGNTGSHTPALGAGDGTYTLYVRAAKQGSVYGAAASRSWVLDTLSPHTTIETSPPDPVTLSTISIDFRSDDGGVSFWCDVAAGGYQSCSSPFEYDVGQDNNGLYTVSITAVDSAGNTELAAATVDWNYIEPPRTVITSGPATDSTSGSVTTFTFAAENLSDGYYCALDDAPLASCTSPYVLSGLSEGSHTFGVFAYIGGVWDTTPELVVWTVQDTTPQVSILAPTGAHYTGTAGQVATFSASQSPVDYYCNFNSAGWAACNSGDSFTALSEGAQTLQVTAVNQFDVASAAPAVTSWTYVQAPDTSIDGMPPAVSGPTAVFSFSSADVPAVDGFLCQLDAETAFACDSGSHMFSGLSDGAHTFYVQAYYGPNMDVIDASAASYAWSVDATKPTTEIQSATPDPITDTEITVTFTANEAASFHCRLDSGSWSACSSPTVVTTTEPGQHQFEVTATDSYGNIESPAATTTWTIAGAAFDHTLAIGVGDSHGCAITSATGEIFCWGVDTMGQMGGAIGAPYIGQMGSDTDWESLSGGPSNTCAIKTSGSLWCWGSNDSGQLANGTASGTSSSPQQISDTSDWKLVDVGSAHVCAIRDDGTLWCWGGNFDGQLGHSGGTLAVSEVVQVGTATDWLVVSAGGGHTCGLRTNGDAYCWGDDLIGQLGNGASGPSATPVMVASAVTDISAGLLHTCAVGMDTKLYCWGDDSSGQSGQGATFDPVESPTLATSTTGWQAVATGAAHTCAIRTDGTLYCLGGDIEGQLGNGSALTDDQTEPTQESTAGNNWTQIECAGNNCLAVAGDGDVYCWGANHQGQCADDSIAVNQVDDPTILTPF